MATEGSTDVPATGDDKLKDAEQVKSLKRGEFEEAARIIGITGGRGFEHVLELGGEKTLPQSLLCVATGGTISIIGVLSGGNMTAQLGRIFMKQVRMVGIGVGNRDGFEAMLRAMALHRVQPVVDRVFAFEELKEAMAHLASGAHFGKVCIRHGGKA